MKTIQNNKNQKKKLPNYNKLSMKINNKSMKNN